MDIYLFHTVRKCVCVYKCMHVCVCADSCQVSRYRNINSRPPSLPVYTVVCVCVLECRRCSFAFLCERILKCTSQNAVNVCVRLEYMFVFLIKSVFLLALLYSSSTNQTLTFRIKLCRRRGEELKVKKGKSDRSQKQKKEEVSVFLCVFMQNWTLLF